MVRCQICSRELNPTEAELTPTHPLGMSLCLACWADQPKRKIRGTSESKALRQDYAWNYLVQHPCIGCGITDPVVLTFHHRDKGMKAANVADFIDKGPNLAALQTEIQKCDILCWNCHHRLHSLERGTWKQKYMKKDVTVVNLV